MVLEAAGHRLLPRGVPLAHLKQPQHVVRPFEVLPGEQEVPAEVARKGRVRDAEEELARLARRRAVLVEPVFRQHALGRKAQLQVRAVQGLPHLEADPVSQTPRVLAGAREAGPDARAVLRVESEPLGHGLAVGAIELLAECGLVSGQREQRRSQLGDDALGTRHHRRLHDRVVVDVEETGRVLDPLDVAAYPVQVLGDPAEHLVRLQRVFPTPRASPPSAGHYACPASPRTQVSLEPPPWEELTTSEPRLSATRVSPPGTTVMSSPTST